MQLSITKIMRVPFLCLPSFPKWADSTSFSKAETRISFAVRWGIFHAPTLFNIWPLEFCCFSGWTCSKDWKFPSAGTLHNFGWEFDPEILFLCNVHVLVSLLFSTVLSELLSAFVWSWSKLESLWNTSNTSKTFNSGKKERKKGEKETTLSQHWRERHLPSGFQ